VGLESSGSSVASILINPANGIGKTKFLTKAVEDGQFTGVPLQEAERWSKNSFRLLSAIKQSLGMMPSTGNIYQMRVTLGSFVFDQYRVPKDLRAGYSVDDFDEMLRHEMSRGHLMTG
jgi:hypothetical protein